jgi:hypothetical protein
VRLKLPKGPLEKKYTQNWTSEVFTVVKVNKHAPQNSYVVQDEDGYMLPKPYYAHSLQWVDLQKLVPVKRPLNERIRELAEPQGPTPVVEEGAVYIDIPAPPVPRAVRVRQPNVRLQDLA